ncbi:MAG: carbohydrate kinase family protein [Pyrinomonadaceae bacterium]|nr:carbohydrate kinase family protein [Pyrinomonadaceae bacterium]
MKFPFKLRSDAQFDCVGFGTNAVDFLIEVPHYPAYDSKVELTNYIRAAGGEVATTVAGLTRLGLRTAYVGRFGDDDAGGIGWKSLADEGVDMRFAERVAGAGTQIAFIIIDERTGERTVIWQRDTRLGYTADEAPSDAAAMAKVLHFTPHDTGACLRMARAARSAGTVVSIDIDNVFEGVDDVLANVDILISSAEFPERFLGISDPRIAITEMRSRFGCRIAGVTLGARGSLLSCGNVFVETSGFAVPGGCQDTTGAGDAFRVGLLYGLLSGAEIEEGARMANAVAALKCRSLGARTALPTAGELSEFLQKNI